MGPAYGRLLRLRKGKTLVSSRIWRFVGNLTRDEQGQDLVEYALLASFVAIATILGLKAIESTVGTGYRSLDSREQNIWVPPNP